MATKNKGTGYALLGVLAGSAIGAALGLVYSRGTGEENRKALLNWGQARTDEVQRKARSGLQAVQRKAADQIGQVRREAEQRLGTTQRTAEDRLGTTQRKVEDTASSAVNRTKSEAADATGRVEEAVERGLPDTPDSSRGPGESQSQGSSPAL